MKLPSRVRLVEEPVVPVLRWRLAPILHDVGIARDVPAICHRVDLVSGEVVNVVRPRSTSV